jgi:hypothetical protein
MRGRIMNRALGFSAIATGDPEPWSFSGSATVTAHQAREALERMESGAPLREIALSYAVDRSTISRLRARHAAEFD